MRTILLIEDNPVSATAMKLILESHGYAAIHSGTGLEGMAKAVAYQPDLILCDVMLPDILGWDVLQQIRSTPSINATPFIFLSGLDEKQYIRKGMILGADDYLLKPIEPGDLLESVGAVFRKYDRLTQPYVVEMQRVTQELQNVIYKDYLTGLPNRLGLREVMEVQLRTIASQTKEMGYALITLEIEDFNPNPSAGVNALGDELLVAVAQRLSHGLQDQGLRSTLARTHSQQFSIFLQGSTYRPFLENLIKNFLEYLHQPYTLQDQCISIKFKVGICAEPDGSPTDVDHWVNCSRLALQWVKRQVHGQYLFYERQLGQNMVEWGQMEQDLHQVLAQRQLQLDYQPIVNLITGRVVTMEALLRWNHPQLGTIIPPKFIPIAEAHSSMYAIDLWVLATALEQVQYWRSHCRSHVRVAVNLSPKTIRQPDLVEQISHLLEVTGAEPHALVLELTETSLFDNLEATHHTLQRLKMRGIQIALDDFGQGYSSLHYLRALPLDILKVDHKLVQNLEQNTQNQAILKAIIRMAQSLDLKVVAEGVETKSQLHFLQSQGYHMLQGFVYSHPLNQEASTDFLAHSQEQTLSAA